MGWLQNRKFEKELKRTTIDSINMEIESGNLDLEGVKNLHEIVKIKRDIKMNGVEIGDVVKIVGNVIVVVAVVGFEISHIINQKASRFLKVL